MLTNKVVLSSRIVLLMVFVLLIAAQNEKVFFVFYTLLIPYLVLYLAFVPGGKIRAFNGVGDYSYGIYIYAFPIQQSFVAVMPNISPINLFVISFGVTFVLAVASWHLVEKKILDSRRKNQKS